MNQQHPPIPIERSYKNPQLKAIIEIVKTNLLLESQGAVDTQRILDFTNELEKAENFSQVIARALYYVHRNGPVLPGDESGDETS